ncbi:ABC transporter transmembrane domain-containing protein [Streptomyces sp. NPDC007088]|uniref:ABC transporter transmembrane domain-containing protein n=1 Tax=Streptomyces sp. NPDC007088 TaxID=3364773 RepID=UPI0036B884EF
MGTEQSGHGVIRRAIAGQRRDLALGSVLSSAHQTGEALVPVLIGSIVDRAVARPDGAALAGWLVVLLGVYVVLSVGFRYGSQAGERAAEQAAHRLRLDVVARVLAPHGGAETGRPPGALVNVATEDARRVGALNMALTLAVAAVVGCVMGAVLLLRASLPLGLLVLVGAPFLMVLGHLLSRPLEHRSEAEQESAAHASAVAADLVAGVRVLKGLRSERTAADRYRRTSQASLAANLRAARAEALQHGLMLALTGAFIALVALVGGRLVLNGSIGLGALVSAVGLALFLPGPIGMLAWAGAEFAKGRASAARIAAVLAAPGETSGGTAAPDDRGPGELRLRGLGHEGLQAVDLHVRPGEHLGIVVTDSADASTLLRCLARQCDPDRGHVELDGTPFTELAPEALRSALLVAEHDTQLFDGTLLANVTAAAPPGCDPGPAMAAAAVDQVAALFPAGVGSAVGERGSSLSGGQRQRVALARALAAERSVLVVHDPTTAVDAATEARIAAGIRRVRAGRTTVLVTSSPALLAATDRVVLIDGGTVAAEAPHEDLVRGHSLYRAVVLS